MQRRLRLLIAGERGDFGGSRAREVALVLNNVETGGRSDVELLPLRRKDLLLQDALAPRSFKALASLLDGHQGVGDLQAHLFLELLQADLLLADRQLVADHIGASCTVSNRNGQLQADAVVGKIAGKELRDSVAVATQQEAVAAGASE